VCTVDECFESANRLAILPENGQDRDNISQVIEQKMASFKVTSEAFRFRLQSEVALDKTAPAKSCPIREKILTITLGLNRVEMHDAGLPQVQWDNPASTRGDHCPATNQRR
jgi:hypothetical protein